MTPTRGVPAVGALFERVFSLVLFGGLSLTLFGRGVLKDPSGRVVGDAGADKTLYMWSLKWWPDALARGHNPLDVDTAWAPHGFDLGLGTAGGGLALVAAPLTAAFGPVPTYNALALLAPMLAATTAFVLAREVTGSFLPALVSGYVFGFSSYQVGHLMGHLPLAFVALLPVVPYLVVRRHRQTLSRRAYVSGLTAVLASQFLIVPQTFFTLLLVGGVAAAAAVAVLGASTVRRVLVESGVALFATAVILAPIGAYAAVSDAAAPARSAFAESADIFGYVVPIRRTLLRPPGSEAVSERFTATAAEEGAYLGLPFILLGALAVVGRGRSRPRLFLALVFVATVLLTLGTRVKGAGEVIAVGPWAVLAAVPIMESALPIRLTVYTSLLAGLLVALALADRRSVARWLLVVAGVAVTLPAVRSDAWSSPVERVAFFGRGRDARYIEDGSTTLLLPYGPAGWSMLWHAEAGFRFRIVGGHFGLRVTPAERKWRDVYEALGTGRVDPQRLRSFLAVHGVETVVVAPGTRGSARRAVEVAVGAEPTHALDALVYDFALRLAAGCRSIRGVPQAPAGCAIKSKEH